MDLDGDESQPTLIKIALSGDGGSGKTSFASRVVDDSFNANSEATASAESSYAMRTFNKVQYKLNIVDNPGQENIRHLREESIKEADVIAIFQKPNLIPKLDVEVCVQEVVQYGGTSIVFLILSMKDLMGTSVESERAFPQTKKMLEDLSNREWEYKEGNQVKRKQITFTVCELSSKTGENVEETLRMMVDSVIKYRANKTVDITEKKKKLKCLLL